MPDLLGNGVECFAAALVSLLKGDGNAGTVYLEPWNEDHKEEYTYTFKVSGGRLVLHVRDEDAGKTEVLGQSKAVTRP